MDKVEYPPIEWEVVEPVLLTYTLAHYDKQWRKAKNDQYFHRRKLMANFCRKDYDAAYAMITRALETLLRDTKHPCINDWLLDKDTLGPGESWFNLQCNTTMPADVKDRLTFALLRHAIELAVLEL